MVLLGLFAVQHSVMARRGFKRWWTRIVPERWSAAPSCCSRASALGCCCGNGARSPSQRSGTSTTRRARGTAFDVLVGWAVLLISTFLINHFELFGLRQVFARLLGREIPAPKFHTPVFYATCATRSTSAS